MFRRTTYIDLGDDVLELRLPPGLGGVGHDGQDGVVKLIVLVVQEHKLRPQMSLLCRTQNLEAERGDVEWVLWIDTYFNELFLLHFLSDIYQYI